MNDWHQYVLAGLPTVTVLLAIRRADRRMDDLKVALRETREDLKATRSGIIDRVDRVADNLREIYLMLGRHDARLYASEKDRKS